MGISEGVIRVGPGVHRMLQHGPRISTIVQYTSLVMLLGGGCLNLWKSITKSFVIGKLCFHLHVVYYLFVYI